ncbi:MAG TPA: sigma factor-like helix-turn-helix DNA-binding protein [Trebonia sp.]|nr:sigma factor-like helix-turn-helix DNA-binding protein [Trebonia sp.]
MDTSSRSPLTPGDGFSGEALVLRFYLDMSEEETARAMGISRGTVKSATSRAVTALGRMLKEGA